MRRNKGSGSAEPPDCNRLWMTEILRLMRSAVLFSAILISGLSGSVHAQQDASAHHWRLDQRSRIDTMDGRDAFGSVVDVSVGTDGLVYVADGMEKGVRVYSRTGRLLRIIGRRGSGPGEFLAVGRLSWIGDTLVVQDPSVQRFILFNRTGALLDSFRPTVGAYLTRGVLGDRSILAQPRSREYALAAGPSMPLLRVFTATRVDTVARVVAQGSGACVGDRLRVCL